MIPLELSIVEPLGRLTARPWADEVTGMQIDSRRIDEGDLFVAVGGGTDFIAHALARGAAATLVPDDAHAALAALGGAVRDRSSARIVGITGATGKTTTKDILAALCAPHRETVASEGNYNNELGVPLTLARIEPSTEVCIVEMGMRGLGQIAWLASFARPDIGLITNIAPVHLELVGTVENVARAKAELIDALPPGGHRRRPRRRAAPRALPHARGHRDPPLRRRRPRPAGSRSASARSPSTTSYSAPHQLRNTLAALTVCDVLGIPLPDGGTLDVRFSPLREELIELPGGITVINDCYNANPASMRAALEHLRALAGDRRKVAVLGEMAELGDSAAELHRRVGDEIAAAGLAVLVAVGPLAEGYGAPAGAELRLTADAAEAAEAAAELVRPGDVVLDQGLASGGTRSRRGETA